MNGSEQSPHRAVLMTLARSVVAVVGLLYAYFTLPMDLSFGRDLGLGVLTLTLFAVIFARQVRRIRRARYPMLRAVEALVMVATLFVVVLAAVHVSLASQNPDAYSEPMSRLDGIYFTVTVLATVGFGDIAPVSDEARIVTTLQMVGGVALLGAGVRFLFSVASATRAGHQQVVPVDGSDLEDTKAD